MNQDTNIVLNNSKSRLAKIDNKSKVLQHVEGRLEPNIDNMDLGEVKKFTLSVLHIDINDFKNLMRSLSHEQYRRFVTLFLTEMTSIVIDLDGMIDRYVGDQVTAVFGIDHKCADCASEKAVKCALNMQTIIKYALNPYLVSVDLPSFRCSIGLDYGEIWFAKVGVKGNNQFTLIGNTVLLAANLVDIAPDGKILLGEGLYNNLSNQEKNHCSQMKNEGWQWTWNSNKQPVKFFLYNAQWGNYSL